MADNAEDAEQSPDLKQVAQMVVSELTSVQNLEKIEKVATNALTEAIKIAFMGVTIVGKSIIGPAATGILQGMETAKGEYSELAAAALGAMLNTHISASDVSGGGGGGSLGQSAGAAIFRSFGEASTPLQPSDANAHKFIANMVDLAVEGWLNGFLFEMLSKIETAELCGSERFADIKDTLVNTLGLGRLARRVMGPYVNAVVVTPFTWQLNKTYRPKLLSTALAAKQYHRGRWTIEQVAEELARDGWSEDRIEALIADARKAESTADVIYMLQHGLMQLDAAVKIFRAQGYDDAALEFALSVEQARALQPILESQAAAVTDAYLDGHATDADLDRVFGVAYIDDGVREAHRNLVTLRAMARQKRISKADMETCVKRNLASVQDYRNWLAAEGYDDQSALLHELLLSDEINDATEAAKRKAKIAADKAAAAAKKLADDAAAALKKQTELDAGVPFLSGIETAVVQGLMPIEKYRAAVVAKGASADVVAALVAVVNGKREAWLAAEQKRQDAIARAANKGISLAKLESAVMAGILTIADYDTRLQLDGFNDADVQILHNLLQAKMGAKAAADVLHATAIGTAAAKGLSLSEADAAVLDGTWTLTDYSGWLTSHGWNDLDAAVLTSHVAAQLAARQAAQAARDALVAKQLDKGLSLGQIEAAVIKGVRTLDDYRAFLVAQHYDADAQSTLVDLLQQKIDAHGAATATRDAVKTATASKTFTLDQEERAVLVGALTLADYRDYLTRAGYGPEDVAALTGLLVDRLAAWGAAKTLLDQVDATASAAGLDLGALESDVLDGTSTIDDYTAALRGLGVADADVATLTDVLQQRVTAAGDAAQLAAGIDAALKLKQLSLSQWDAAVLDGLRTTDDYSAFLLAQGYAPSDAGVLVAIVQRKLDAQAGKRKA